MSFTNNVITSVGKNLIAQATSSNPIIYTGCKGSETYLTESQLAALSTINGLNDASGVIVSASASENVARIIAGFNNQQTSKTLKSVGVYGRLQSQASGDEVFILACSDETASIRIPGASEASTQVQIAFNVAVDDDASVTVTSGNHASIGDLERMVSCHAPGQPNVGVDQNVYGEKTFKSDSTNFEGIQNTEIRLKNGSTSFSVGYDDDSQAVVFQRNIPDPNEYSHVAFTWRDSWVMDVVNSNPDEYYNDPEFYPEIMNLYALEDGGKLQIVYIDVNTLYAKQLIAGSWNSDDKTLIFEGVIEPRSYGTRQCTLGTPEHYFDHGYFTTVHTKKLSPEDENSIIGTTLQPTGSTCFNAARVRTVESYSYEIQDRQTHVKVGSLKSESSSALKLSSETGKFLGLISDTAILVGYEGNTQPQTMPVIDLRGDTEVRGTLEVNGTSKFGETRHNGLAVFADISTTGDLNVQANITAGAITNTRLPCPDASVEDASSQVTVPVGSTLLCWSATSGLKAGQRISTDTIPLAIARIDNDGTFHTASRSLATGQTFVCLNDTSGNSSYVLVQRVY